MYLDNSEFKVGQGDIGHNLPWSVGHGVSPWFRSRQARCQGADPGNQPSCETEMEPGWRRNHQRTAEMGLWFRQPPTTDKPRTSLEAPREHSPT